MSIISDIIDGFKWSIDFFIDKVPKPIKFILFLLLLMLFGAFFSTILHFTGIHCDSNNNAYKTSFFNFVSNYKITSSAGQIINQTEYTPVTNKVTVFEPDCMEIYCRPPINDSRYGEDIFYLYGGDNCAGADPIYTLSRDGGVLFGVDLDRKSVV